MEEIEARFGKFSNGKFIPGITKQQYNDLYHYLVNRYTPSVKEQSIIVYEGNVKEISEGTNVSYMTKERKSQTDDVEYGVRIAFSIETPIEKFNKVGKKILYKENRTRLVFESKKEFLIFVLDTKENSLTIELEQMPGCRKDVFDKNVQLILQILQESDIIISATEQRLVLEKYYSLFNKKKFIGVQPFTISEDKIQPNTSYLITKKLDGQRFLLMTLNDVVFSISTKLIVRKLPYLNKAMGNYVFDVEYFRNSFHIFDIIMDAPFNKRMEKIQEFYKNFSPYTETKINFYIKVYEKSDNLVNLFKEISSGLDYKIFDGLILIKEDATYFNSAPLKWKPAEMNTVDFLIEKSNDNCFVLYTETTNGLQRFASTVVKPSEYKKFLDNTVVEFSFNKKWIPIRPRFDKEKPNFIKVAEDNLKATMNPFNPESLSKTVNRKDAQFYNLRRFHNWIKRKYINMYPKDKVLDLACGKGGDFTKYSGTTKYVEGYDINPSSIQEASSRINSMKNNDIEFRLSVLDLNKETINSKKNFDLVVCNFAFHYLYRNIKNFIETVVQNTKKGSILMITVFDKNLIKKDINTESFSIKIVSAEKISVSLKDSVLDKPEVENLVDIEKVIKTFSEHGLTLKLNIPFKELYAEWKSKSNSLSLDEKKFSFLNVLLIFEKE